jgi:hypothetical protein
MCGETRDLEERNATIQRIEGPEYKFRQHEERVNHLLQLTRYGHDFVANPQ